MNKKTVIIIVAAVAALAVIIAGVIVMLISSFNFANPDSSSSESTSSQGDTLSDTQQSDKVTTNSKDTTDSSENKGENSTNNDDANETINTTVPNKAAFYIANTKAEKGTTVKVPVKVTKNPGFMAFIINFEYDTKALKYKSYKSGDVLTNYEIEDNNGTIKFMSLENNDVKKDGTLVYLEFEVLDSASGKSEIKLNIPEESIANYDEQFVNLASQNGYVEIK